LIAKIPKRKKFNVYKSRRAPNKNKKFVFLFVVRLPDGTLVSGWYGVNYPKFFWDQIGKIQPKIFFRNNAKINVGYISLKGPTRPKKAN
jgi:hypothetical protein